MVTFLHGLASHPALANPLVASTWRAALSFWNRRASEAIACEQFALAVGGWKEVEEAVHARLVAFAIYKLADYEVWRLQRYSNVDQAYAEANAASAAFAQ